MFDCHCLASISHAGSGAACMVVSHRPIVAAEAFPRPTPINKRIIRSGSYHAAAIAIRVESPMGSANAGDSSRAPMMHTRACSNRSSPSNALFRLLERSPRMRSRSAPELFCDQFSVFHFCFPHSRARRRRAGPLPARVHPSPRSKLNAQFYALILFIVGRGRGMRAIKLQ